MEKSWVVHGVQGSGKTRHAAGIARVLGLRFILDDWDGGEYTFYPLDTLHLTNVSLTWVPDASRVLNIDDALARVRAASDVLPPLAWSPERDLVGAVLQRGCLDYVDWVRQGGVFDMEQLEAGADAVAWLDSDSDAPMSFRWCCNILGVDSDWLRSIVARRAVAPWEFKHATEAA